MEHRFYTFELRLIDAIELLIELRDVYYQPRGFIRKLNSTIQELRNVTFVLQKCGKYESGFDVWYEGWRSRLSADCLLKWLVEARNKVVKQGDLEVKSVAHVKIYENWYEPPVTTVTVSPTLEPDDYAESLSKIIPPHIKTEEALLLVERSWVLDELPDAEIVSVLDHCAETLLELYDSLLYTFKLDKNTQLDEVVTSWREMTADFRACWFKLQANQVFQKYSYEKQTTNNIDLEEAKKRYNLENETLDDIETNTPFQQRCAHFFKMGLSVLRTDKYHGSYALVFSQDNSMHIVQLAMEDRAEKHIAMRELADKLPSLKAQSVIVIAEAWVAPFNPKYIYPANDPNRGEGLSLCGVTREGEFFNISQRFDRIDGQIYYLHKASADVKISNIMLPLWKKLKESW